MSAFQPSDLNVPGDSNDWYNYTDTTLEVVKLNPWSDTNVHQIQTLEDYMECGITLSQHRETTDHIESTDRIFLNFTVDGGAEIPHFRLILTLPCSGKCQKLVFLAIWTAWGETGRDNGRVARGVRDVLDKQARYTFSSKLENEIRWSHNRPPYCLNFETPVDQIVRLEEPARQALRAFLSLRQPNIDIIMITRTDGLSLPFWEVMTALPVPTPEPFPFHDCEYNSYQGRRNWSSHFPRVDPDLLVREHYRVQYSGARGALGLKGPIGDMCRETPMTFVNERHYEVVKFFGLLREVQRLGALVDRQSRDQTYTFHFFPWLLAHIDWETPFTKRLYYGMIDMSLHIGHTTHPMLDLELPFPDLGSPVRFTIMFDDSGEAKPRTFQGVVVRSPAFSPYIDVLFANPVYILAFWDLDIDPGQELSGKVSLVPPNFLYEQAVSTLMSALYDGRRADGVLKRLLLGHDVQFPPCTE
ncbi:uncharacterized protein BDV17DRAFT_292561 [Aspergillus undulatus]|uniref:uncharacterized protein n=1 Tax=Aspergillus undulatus TaxID=1810928 RepID=UPI003CCE26D3